MKSLRDKMSMGNEQNGLSRRSALGFLASGVAFGLLTPFLQSRAFAAPASADKILIVYFSKTGNTRSIANQIQHSVDGQLFELKTTHAYPAEYRATTELAKREQEDNFRPKLTADIDIKPFDVIFLGYPTWWGTFPMAMFTFLEQHDFAGKTLIPFCTHEGTGLGRGPRDIAKTCPTATVLEGFAARGSSSASAQSDVDSWLHKIALL